MDGAALRDLRQVAGLSVTGLAGVLGVSAGYISAIELGRRRTVAPATFNRICAVLGVERAALLRAEADAA